MRTSCHEFDIADSNIKAYEAQFKLMTDKE